MASIKDEIAKNLHYYRKKNNMTQKQLAEQLGVKNTAVSNWENGLNSIDIETLYKVCKVLGVTFNDMDGVYAIDLIADISRRERYILSAYRSKRDMQAAVDKLLDIGGSEKDGEPPQD
jgi:transcriptional regulator with XRE-family HTH domain